MIILGLTVATNSIKSLINKEVYTFSIGLIIICIITIIIKFSLYLYTRKIAKEYNNLLVKANCKDHRNDTIITSINLLSIILHNAARCIALRCVANFMSFTSHSGGKALPLAPEWDVKVKADFFSE